MIQLVKPQVFVPVHGTIHHLLRHAALARELGVPETSVLENGDVAELDETGLRKTGRVPVGRVHVFAKRAVSAKVLQERQFLASRGVAHAVVSLDSAGRIAGEIILATHGVMDGEEDADLLAAVRREACSALEEQRTARGASPLSDEEIAEAARQAIRRAFGRVLGFKPMTTAIVIRVGRLPL